MTLQHELVTEPIFGQIMALVALLGGIVLIVGVVLSKRTTLSTSQRVAWLRQIREMAHGEDLHEYSADDLQAARRQWVGQQGATFIGAGIGLLVGVAASFTLVQFISHAPFSLPFAFLWLLYLPPIWGIIIGFVAGCTFVARRHAALGSAETTGVEPPISHKVSDYRSPLLPLIVAFPAIVYTALAIQIAPKYHPYTPFEMREYALIPPPHWILAIYPCALWLTVLIVEGCVWARVKAPASITSPDATFARGASMALTGLNLTSIYSMMVFIPNSVGGSIMLLLPPGSPLFFSAVVACGPLLIGTLSMTQVSGSEGRLGGRLTGWPWSRGAARDGTAAARGDGAV